MRVLIPPSLFLVVGVSLTGCGDGGGGDTLGAFKGDVLGQGRSLASINDQARVDGSVNPRPSRDDTLSVTGVRVTWVDRYDETGNGKGVGNIFLQDFTSLPGPFEGVLAFQSSYSPPSFRTSVGDVVDITGQYQEFQLIAANKDRTAGWSTPEFVGGNIALRFDAPYIPIVPVEISLADLLKYESPDLFNQDLPIEQRLNRAGTGRRWMSMVVKVRNVQIVADLKEDASGRIQAAFKVPNSDAPIPALSNELFDLQTYAAQIKAERGLTTLAGLEFESITGIVTAAFQFNLSPRNADDLKIK